MPTHTVSFRSWSGVVVVLTCVGASAVAVAQQGQLVNGGEVTIRREGDIVHVALVGPRAGLASLCVGDAARVRILHASAAVGDATYEKAEGGWKLRHGFEWRLRDAPPGAASATAATGPANDPEMFFAETGWVANTLGPDESRGRVKGAPSPAGDGEVNASRAGAPKRDFKIRVTARTQYLGVTYLSVNDPMLVSYWPSTLDDDCKQMKIGQGHLPEMAQFKPETWTRIQP